DSHDQRADQRSPHGSNAAKEARSADDHRGNRVELGAVARKRKTRIQTPRKNHSAQSRQSSAYRIHHRQSPVDRYAREQRRLLVAANRVNVASKRRARQKYMKEPIHRDNQNHRHRNVCNRTSAPETKSFRQFRNWKASRNNKGKTSRDVHHSQSRNKRMRQPKLCQQQPVDHPQRRAYADSRRNTHRPGHACFQHHRPQQHASPRIEPTDRSMPAVMITSNCPSARRALTDDCRKTFMRLSKVRKYGERKLKIADTTSRPSNGANRRITLPPARRQPCTGAALGVPIGAGSSVTAVAASCVFSGRFLRSRAS